MENAEKVSRMINNINLFIADIKASNKKWYEQMQNNRRYDYIEYIVKNDLIIADLLESISYIEYMTKEDKDADFLVIVDDIMDEAVKTHFRQLEYESVFNSTRAMENLVKVWKLEVMSKLKHIYKHMKLVYQNDFEFTPYQIPMYYECK